MGDDRRLHMKRFYELHTYCGLDILEADAAAAVPGLVLRLDDPDTCRECLDAYFFLSPLEAKARPP